MNISQVKMYLDGGIILIVLPFFIGNTGNNSITMAGWFQMVCLEKDILEIVLAAINYTKGDNLSKGNE